MDSAVWGFIGTFVGAGVSLLTTFFNNKHGAKLKREERDAAREQEARAFQRETLLQLQDEVGRCVELYSRSFGGADIEKSREFSRSGMIVMRLAQRITDEPLRDGAISFLDYVSSVHAESCEPQVDGSVFERMQESVARQSNELNRTIGAVLRTQL